MVACSILFTQKALLARATRNGKQRDAKNSRNQGPKPTGEQKKKRQKRGRKGDKNLRGKNVKYGGEKITGEQALLRSESR